MAPAYARGRDAALAEYEAALARLEDPALGHYLGRDGLVGRIAHLQSFGL